MTPMVAVLRREFVARRALLSIALAAAVIAWLMPFAPGFGDDNAAEVRSLASFTLALTLGWGLAIGLGATTFGGDLSEGRFGFFLARPVSANSLWFGRILAVVLLSLAAELIVIVPALVGDGVQVPIFGSFLQWQNLLLFLAAPILLALLAHTLSIMLRARTAWLFLDLVGAVVTAVVLWWVIASLVFSVAMDALMVVVGGFLLVLLGALMVAGLAGVAVGRSDLRRTHRAVSIVLWMFLALGMVGVWAGVRWLWDFGPDKLAALEVHSAAANGEWIEITGTGQRRLDVRRRFLYSTRDGRFVALPTGWFDFLGESVFSRDGSRALWRGFDFRREPGLLEWVDLRGKEPELQRSTIVVSPEAIVTLSADGGRCAVLEEGLLSVYEVDGDRLLTATHLPDRISRATVLFESNSSLRIFGRPDIVAESALTIARMDLETGKIVLTGGVPDLEKSLLIALDAEMQTAVVWSRSDGEPKSVKFVVDAVDGSRIRVLGNGGFPRFLGDGRLLTMDVGAEGVPILIIESVDGGERIEHQLPAGRAERLIGEVMPGLVAVSRHVDPIDPTRGVEVDLIDLQTGEVQPMASPLRGHVRSSPWQNGHAGAILWYAEQPEAHRLFIDQTGAVVRWEPGSGELIHVVGGGR